MMDGAVKDRQSITADWTPLISLLEGVRVREVKNVPKNNGTLTEIFRTDWQLDAGSVQQVFQTTMMPGGVSAWHAHRSTTDRLFVSLGLLKIVLYDAREASPSRGRVNEFRFGTERPALVVVPPGVWHGVQNIGDGPGLLLNLVDRAYRYEDPDHWRLPADTPKIPYSFAPGRLADGLR
jgi:dTDP-4-dehydrorhamnose 3,5-epimerase